MRFIALGTLFTRVEHYFVGGRTRKQRSSRRLQIEPLEARHLLTASSPISPPDDGIAAEYVLGNEDDDKETDPADEPVEVAGAFLHQQSPFDNRSMSYNDIVQYQGGICAFASALSAVARTNIDLAGRITTATGGYNVRLFNKNLQLTTVFVPNFTIQDTDLQPADNGEVWPAIFNRAFQTLSTSESKPFTNLAWCFESLTGVQSTDTPKRQFDSFFTPGSIATALANGQPVALGTIDGTTDLLIPGSNGLIETHAYTVVGIEGTSGGANGTWITIRNPWGEDTSWSHYDTNHNNTVEDSEREARRHGLDGYSDGIIRLHWNNLIPFVEHIVISGYRGPSSINNPRPATLSLPSFLPSTPTTASITSGQELQITFKAVDSQNRFVSYQVREGDPGYVNLQTGKYTWTPNQFQFGTYYVTIVADVNSVEYAAHTVVVTVTAGYTTVGSLTADKTSIKNNGTDLVTLTARNARSGFDPYVNGVQFYRDADGDGSFNIYDDVKIAEVEAFRTNGSDYSWSGYLGALNVGTTKLFAVAWRNTFASIFYGLPAELSLTVTAAPVIAPVATAIQTTQVFVPPVNTNLSDHPPGGAFLDSQGNIRTFYSEAGNSGRFMQKFSPTGQLVGSRVLVASLPSVMLPDGSYVVVSEGIHDSNGRFSIYAQWYTSSGSLSGGRITVASSIQDFDGLRSLVTAADASGNLLIAFAVGSYSDTDVYAVSLSRAGVVTRAPWRVGTASTGLEQEVTVSLNASGSGVIAWLDFAQDKIIARQVTSYGQSASSEFTVGTGGVSIDVWLGSAVNAAGDFVIAWPKQSGPSSIIGVGVRMYGNNGTPKGPEFLADTFRGGNRGLVRVAMNDMGWSVVAWNSQGQDPGGDQYNNGVYAQVFDPSGAKAGPEFRVPTTYASNEYISGLVMTADSDITFLWNGIDSASKSQTYLRQYRINFAPTFASSFTLSVPENSAANTAVGTVQAADIDPGQLTYTLLGDSPFGINATTGALIVTNPARLDFETKASWNLQVRATDDQGASVVGNVTVNVTDVNDAPVIVPLPTPLRYEEFPEGLSLLDGATITDTDTVDYGGGRVVVDITAGRATGDQLTLLSRFGASLSGTNVLVNNALVGSLLRDGATGPLEIVFTAGVDRLKLQTILRSIVFRSLLHAPSTAQRTVQFTVVDGSSGPSAVITKTVDVASINDAPENAAPTNLLMYPGQTVAVTGIAISDVDVGTANLSVSLSVGKGNLTLATGVVNGLTSGQIVGNGAATVTITAPLAAINATLNSASGLRYRNLSGVVGADALTIVTNDRGNSGDGGALVDTDTVAIALMPSTFTVTGPKLTVTGASTADTLSIQFISPTSFIANHNGQGGVFPTSLISQIELLGGSGNDLALVTTPVGLDTATFNSLGGTITGVGYSLVFNSIETKYVFGDGEDVATFNDTAGDDLFWALPGYSLMVGSNPSYINEVIGFGPSITANSTTGFDVAQLIGSSAVEAYVGGVASSSLTGPSINFVANGFDQNYGYSGGGADTAVLNGSSGTDTMYGFNAYSILVASNILQYVVGYTDVTGNAGTGTGDIAILYDSQGDDTFVAGPTTARLSGPGYSYRANGFDQVHANAFGGNDTATFDGSTGNDVFYGYSTHAQLYSSGVYFLQTNRFELTHVNLSSGSGNDLAFLFDGLLNDQFTASGNQAELIYANGARNRLTAFDAVYAYSQNGGTNRKTVTNPLAFGLTFNGTWA